MNRKALEKYISQKTGLKKCVISKTVNSFFEIICDAMQKGEEINIAGFGKFYTKQRNERSYVNFHTGESFVAPKKNIPYFKFSKKIINSL